MLPSLARLALPDAVTEQEPTLGPVAVPVTLHSIDEPANVPVPVPVTTRVPKHVAENVPEPVRPEISVIDHTKFAHVPAVEGSGETDTHVPSSEFGSFDLGAVGAPEQAAPSSAATRPIAQQIRPMGRL